MTIREIGDGIEAEERELERAALDNIKPLYGIRRGKKAFEDEEKKLRAPIDKFFQMTGSDIMWDDESGFKVWLGKAPEKRWYEAPSAIKEANGSLYGRLEALGCFALDGALVERALKQGLITRADYEAICHVGEGTRPLRVEKMDAELDV